jgi:hypothetical protein
VIYELLKERYEARLQLPTELAKLRNVEVIFPKQES